MLQNWSLVSCLKLLRYFPFLKSYRLLLPPKMEKQGQDLSSYLKQQKTENIRDNDLQGTDIRQQKTAITKRWETKRRALWLSWESFQSIVEEGKKQVEIGDSLSREDGTDTPKRQKHLGFSGKSSKRRNCTQKEYHNTWRSVSHPCKYSPVYWSMHALKKLHEAWERTTQNN